MTALRYTLIADGSSDRCLIHIVDWLLKQLPDVARCGFVPQVADTKSFFPQPTSTSERIRMAVKFYPCDLVLIHRDAENQRPEMRRDEIRTMVANPQLPPYVPVIPVRMTEAWLLLDEQAIRTASDNPNGQIPLQLPQISSLERLPDPKEILWQLLIAASEKVGRRRGQFERQLFHRRQRVAELIRDFSPLRRLIAFQTFENELRAAALAWYENRMTEDASGN